MKKIFCFAAAFVIAFTLTACKTEEKEDNVSSAVEPTKSDLNSSSVLSETVVPTVENIPDEPVITESKEVQEKVYVGVEEIKLSAYEKTFNVGERFMPMVTMLPENASNKAEIWESDNTAVATVNKYGNITAIGEGSCTVTVKSADKPELSAVFKVTVNAPVKVEMTYRDGILIVNKSYPLPSDYNPGINGEAKEALNRMFTDAKAEKNLNMWVCSGFRSYNVQKNLYNNYVKRDGVQNADRYSARPGYSEHQTGLAFDINYADSRFEGTDQAIWLAENAYKYGFILRYPEGKEHITGYMYEPWHYRYIGVENAAKIFASGLTLEEYYGLTSVYAE